MLKVRGYVSSRKFLDNRVPQHVQNLVIRDYCNRKRLLFLLSAVEFAMPNSFITMEKVLSELPEIDGIVFYSLFQLPAENDDRKKIYSRVLEKKCTIHFAVESLKVKTQKDTLRVENIWAVSDILSDITPVSSLENYIG